VGEDLGACWRRLSPRRLGTQVGRVAFKRRVTLLEGDRVFALPYASCLSTFQAPGWGISAIFPLRRWRNATLRELVPFSRRSASRIFIMQPGRTPPPAVTQDGDHQLDGGEKRAGLLPPPCPQLQGSSSPLLGRRVRRVGRPPPRGSVALFFPRCLGGKASPSTAEAFPRHAGVGGPPLLSQGAAFRPPSGRRLRRMRAGHVQAFLAPTAASVGRPARRVPRGRRSCSGRLRRGRGPAGAL
jgi:hypothetical protein